MGLRKTWWKSNRKVSRTGCEPATQRIQAQLQYGLYSILLLVAAVNLAVVGSTPTDIRFALIFSGLMIQCIQAQLVIEWIRMPCFRVK
jgi:hypothetical protein